MSTLTEQEAAADLREAKEVLASFVSKRADHEEHLAKLGEERAGLSYDAHRGDPKARKRLDAVHLEAAKADSEFISLDAAVRTAQEKVRDAERAVAQAEQAAVARRIVDMLPLLREHGALLDAAARQVLDSYHSLQGIVRDVRELTAPPRDAAGLPVSNERAVVSEALMRTACRRSLIAAFTTTDLELERLAPNERHSFTEVVDGWARSIEGWASRRLPETLNTETEEA